MQIEKQEDKSAAAKKLIQQFLTEPKPVQAVYAFCKTRCPELTKQDIRQARLELGVQSSARFGIHHWRLEGAAE